MKILLFILSIIAVVNCNILQRKAKPQLNDDIYVSDRRLEKKYFFPMFKMSVFIRSVQFSFNDSPEIRKLLREDFSNGAAGESLDHEDVDSVAKIVSARVKLDSSANKSMAPDDLRGKRVFQTCLEFYQSKELNEIANRLYKSKYSKPYILHTLNR